MNSMRIVEVAKQDWSGIERSLDDRGNAVLRGLLTSSQCERLAGLYARDDCFRSRVVMARYGFGKGEYKYFSYPLPPLLEELRHALYPRLVALANRWNERLAIGVRYPATLQAFLDRCHEAGQLRPTPLLLQYGEGDYNCLHRDLYGDHLFPLQATILLSRPEQDFTGGEFVMTESRASRQTIDVVSLLQGDAVVFTVNQRPVPGLRGRSRRVAMRHGVSRVSSGQRHTVGLIFHDAQ
jgi:hypothetical protein